jgi:hypothetical protein
MHCKQTILEMMLSFVVFSIGAQFPVAATAANQTSFTIIATGGGNIFSTFGNCPSINNNGTVAFKTILSDHNTIAIYTGDGVNYKKIISSFQSIQDNPSINDDGYVAFGAYSGTNGVWKSNGIALKQIYQPTTSVSPSINASGYVGFSASTGSGHAIVLAGNGTSLKYIADESCNFSSVSTPVLNDLGTAVFMGQDLGTVYTAIYKGSGGALQRIIGQNDSLGNGTTISSLDNRPTLNNAGDVVFRVADSLGIKRLMLFKDGSISQIADNTGQFADFYNDYGSRPAINNNGLIVFHATLDDGTEGLFSGPDPVADKIILRGENLFGYTMNNFVLGADGINDKGQIAFQALVQGGPPLIVRASILVPEPSTLCLIVMALTSLIYYRFSRYFNKYLH